MHIDVKIKHKTPSEQNPIEKIIEVKTKSIPQHTYIHDHPHSWLDTGISITMARLTYLYRPKLPVLMKLLG